MPLARVRTRAPSLGCDPEFFFKINKRVVGSEKIIPKEGIKIDRGMGSVSKFIIDGVQAELNPRPNTCRANLANEMSACFKTLKATLDKSGEKVDVSFEQSVKISKTELAKLDKENQVFGCDPSLHAHGESGIKIEEVDPLTHLQRSAGGHIHIGANYDGLKNLIKKEPEKLVQMLDIICGNTCVLVDRDKGNKERRKLYGAAGEYRLPKHGLEYRVLSNFWLQAYPLMSLTFGLARIAVELMSDATNADAYYQAFTEAVDMEDIKKAINTNNYALAMKNFKKIEKLLCEVTQQTDHFCLWEGNMKDFHYFSKMIKEKGLKHWFDFDPMEHWVTLRDGHHAGCHDFLRDTVSVQRKIFEKKEAFKALPPEEQAEILAAEKAKKEAAAKAKKEAAKVRERAKKEKAAMEARAKAQAVQEKIIKAAEKAADDAAKAANTLAGKAKQARIMAGKAKIAARKLFKMAE